MATARRTREIVQSVLEELSDTGARTYTRERVLREISKVQREVCREAIALKAEDVIALEAGTETYDVDVLTHKLITLIEPAGWQKPVQVINSAAEWSEARRQSRLPQDQPLYGFFNNKVLHLWPAPQTTGEEIGYIASVYPDADITEDKDPQVEDKWDKVLIYGVLSRLAKGKDKLVFQDMYDKFRTSTENEHMQESIVANPRKAHWSSTLRF